MIVFCIGYGLVAQNWLPLISATIFRTVALLFRIAIEEAVLVESLGSQYSEDQRTTKKLTPKLW
jgi:protein-S-isoprenylcysteine O-methyltransferase Ste14